MRISVVVVSHGHRHELPRLLTALGPDVDEILVVANVPGSVGNVPDAVRILTNRRPRSFAANANAGIEATTGELILVSNPDVVPAPGAIETLREFVTEHPKCGLAGPQMLYPDGSWQPSRRRFPTVLGTVVRRTPLRLLFPPYERQRAHYLLTERPVEPVLADWMLGAFLLIRRELLEAIDGFDPGFRMYGEDIDLCYRAGVAGWECWYVPSAIVYHDYAAVVDRRFFTRHTIWHLRAMLRFIRKHPESLRAIH